MKQLQYKHILHLQDEIIQVRLSKHFQQIRYHWDAFRHCNAEYELHLLLRGQIRMEVEQTTLLLEARKGILILPGQYHVPLEEYDNPEHFVLSFTLPEGELAESLHRDISSFKIFSLSADMLQECLAIFQECSILSPYRNEKIHALLTSLMISILRRLNLSPATSPSLSNSEIERADIIDNFFDAHLKDRLGAEDLAKQLYLSERHLNRVIFQLYGMTFQEKMTKAKMDRAAWLLRTTDKKVDEIAEEVGYASEAAFYVAFRKYFQITPQKYRIRECGFGNNQKVRKSL